MQQKSQPAQPLASNDSPSVHQPCEERLPEKANAVNILPAGGSLPTNSNMLAAERDRQSRLTIRPAGGPTSPTTPETAAIARSMRKPGGSSSSRLACAPVSPLQCCVCDARCLELGCAPLMSADFVHAAVRDLRPLSCSFLGPPQGEVLRGAMVFERAQLQLGVLHRPAAHGGVGSVCLWCWGSAEEVPRSCARLETPSRQLPFRKRVHPQAVILWIRGSTSTRAEAPRLADC